MHVYAFHRMTCIMHVYAFHRMTCIYRTIADILISGTGTNAVIHYYIAK